MKQYITFILASLITTLSFAQQGINYKALIKDDLGNVLASQAIGVQFQIRETAENGTAIYTETHTATTDANGILILNIGTGSTSDSFDSIDWSSNDHWLNLQIDLTGGTDYTDISTTQFMTVPYALSAANVSGLEKITENDGTEDKTGWRLKRLNTDFYGPIGDNALDFSFSDSSLSIFGAMGENSAAFGYSTVATGEYSIAAGSTSIASGLASFALGSGASASGPVSFATGITTAAIGIASSAFGYGTIASGYAETTIGRYNIDTPTALFVVGNGIYADPDPIRSNALVVFEDGTITAPSLDMNEITDDKTLITKEFFDTNVPEASSGLEQISEFNGSSTNIGWRLVGADPNNYGPIGRDAIDFSSSTSNSSEFGALGSGSVAFGFRTKASGLRSMVMGRDTFASGWFSTAIGDGTIALSDSSLAIGQFNIETPNSLLVVGNGTFSITEGITRKNALTVLKNGYVITGGPITIQRASDATSSWRLETRPNGSLSMYRNGEYRGFFSESTGNYSSISDRRAKRNIKSLENGTLNKVMQLNPVSYLMKAQTDSKRSLGLISQDVQKIFPTLTTYVKESDLITLSYTELIPILIKALQEQQVIIETQNKQIESISVDNSSLKDIVNNLISRVENIESNNQ